jgi:hypothetical protein
VLVSVGVAATSEVETAVVLFLAAVLKLLIAVTMLGQVLVAHMAAAVAGATLTPFAEGLGRKGVALGHRVLYCLNIKGIE